MSKKKVRWIVSWWDFEKDYEVHKFYDTHEEAITKQFKLKRMGITAQVELK